MRFRLPVLMDIAYGGAPGVDIGIEIYGADTGDSPVGRSGAFGGQIGKRALGAREPVLADALGGRLPGRPSFMRRAISSVIEEPQVDSPGLTMRGAECT